MMLSSNPQKDRKIENLICGKHHLSWKHSSIFLGLPYILLNTVQIMPKPRVFHAFFFRGPNSEPMYGSFHYCGKNSWHTVFLINVCWGTTLFVQKRCGSVNLVLRLAKLKQNVLLFFIKNNVCVQNRTEHYNLHWFNIHQHRVTSVKNH